MIGMFWVKKIQLSGKGEYELLEIALEHSQTLQMFDIAVDLPTIKADKTFGGIYETVGEFKEALIQHFDGLSATEKGSIIYKEKLGKK